MKKGEKLKKNIQGVSRVKTLGENLDFYISPAKNYRIYR
jgi:hypothetical protein